MSLSLRVLFLSWLSFSAMALANHGQGDSPSDGCDMGELQGNGTKAEDPQLAKLPLKAPKEVTDFANRLEATEDEGEKLQIWGAFRDKHGMPGANDVETATAEFDELTARLFDQIAPAIVELERLIEVLQSSTRESNLSLADTKIAMKHASESLEGIRNRFEGLVSDFARNLVELEALSPNFRKRADDLQAIVDGLQQRVGKSSGSEETNLNLTIALNEARRTLLLRLASYNQLSLTIAQGDSTLAGLEKNRDFIEETLAAHLITWRSHVGAAMVWKNLPQVSAIGSGFLATTQRSLDLIAERVGEVRKSAPSGPVLDPIAQQMEYLREVGRKIGNHAEGFERGAPN